ncbi:MAG: S41 family peptidase [Planctomycetota bacterium]
MLIHRVFRRLIVAVVVSVAALGSGLALADSGELRFTSATARELWRKGSDQVLAGDFSAALATFEQVHRLEPNHAELDVALDWLRESRELTSSREDLRLRSFNYFVEEAKKAGELARSRTPIEKAAEASDGNQPDAAEPTGAEDRGEDGEDDEGPTKEDEKPEVHRWSKALDYAQRAMANAKDEDAFRAEPWLQEIVEKTLEEIEEYKSQNDWRDALVLYDILRTLYPDNKAYEDGFDFCRKRAHFDFVYGAKSDWRANLRDVAPGVIEEILGRIEDDYVKEADFKELCTSGLQNLQMLARSPSLAETFPTVGDSDLVDSFVTQLEGLMQRRIEPAPRFRARHVMSVFRRALAANKDSLGLPEAVLVNEFVAGLLEPLDEFTAVIWPAEVDEFNKHTRGKFVGVGIQITQPEGQYVRVESPLEDSPAFKAGIKPGDLITEVDGKSTLEMTINQAVRVITGEPGTDVTLTIRDSLTDQSRKVVLTRQQIEIKTVRGYHRDESRKTGWDYFIDPANKIAYVGVTGFMDKTVEDLDAAIGQLREEGCRGMILDLRFNPGGLLTSAVEMCEVFLGDHSPIVQTRGREPSQNADIYSRRSRGADVMPLIVLVNEYSASASEIVAGALAGLKEACVIGTRTFGKGSVQNLIPIADNQAYLKLTTAHYYIPDEDMPGKWYLLHREEDSKMWGVEPHVVVNVIPQEIMKILRIRRERDLLRGRDQDAIPQAVLDRQPTSQPNLHFQEDDHPDTDPQVSFAVDIMRIKLLSDQPWAMVPRAERVLSHADTEEKIKPPAERH